jgi:hypothetical protein
MIHIDVKKLGRSRTEAATESKDGSHATRTPGPGTGQKATAVRAGGKVGATPSSTMRSMATQKFVYSEILPDETKEAASVFAVPWQHLQPTA